MVGEIVMRRLENEDLMAMENNHDRYPRLY